LPLHFPFSIFLSLSLGGGRRHEATREARLATATGDPRLPGEVRLLGRRGLRGEALLPSASLTVSWICSLFFLFVDVLPLICVVLLRFTAFACCRRVRVGSRVSFSGEVSLISVDLVHSTAYFVRGSADAVFLLFFHFILFVDGEGSFLGFTATVGEFTFPYHSSPLVSCANY
jgi:hypothetical protein